MQSKVEATCPTVASLVFKTDCWFRLRIWTKSTITLKITQPSLGLVYLGKRLKMDLMGLAVVLLEAVWEESELEGIYLEVGPGQFKILDFGLMIAGGMSFLSTQYGWAANNVVDFEVVLANGTIIHATDKQNTGDTDNIPNFDIVVNFQ